MQQAEAYMQRGLVSGSRQLDAARKTALNGRLWLWSEVNWKKGGAGLYTEPLAPLSVLRHGFLHRILDSQRSVSASRHT